MSTLIIGDVFEQLAAIPARSVDLLITSPPFLALRSYLPADHPDKAKEIGSEATPAAFLDTLLRLTVEWRRILAPHGSICVELGDTYSGSGGEPFDGSARRTRTNNLYNTANRYSDEWNKGNTVGKPIEGVPATGGRGWPLAKSLTGIPTLYAWSLAYGRNLLNPAHTLEPWRIRNLIVWGRPNPPVGALGDKFRPATSYITVGCVSAKRYFDLDAVRVPSDLPSTQGGNMDPRNRRGDDWRRGYKPEGGGVVNPAGAPPLDWHADHHPEDGDWLWKLATEPYKGAHYATFPEALPKRLIEAMCPRRVCRQCGKPSERIAETTNAVGHAALRKSWYSGADPRDSRRDANHDVNVVAPDRTERTTLGWTDCGHDDWRNGVVCDPFAGSGTTLAVAVGCGRDAIGIDLDERNEHLIRERCGMFLDVAGQ